MDKLGFLDGAEAPIEDVHVEEPIVDVAPEPAPEPEPQQEPESAEPASQPRDESGRFATKTQPPEGFVPISVVQGLRHEIQQLRGSMQPQQPAPDIFEDQQGFIDQQVMQPINAQITNVNLHWSRRFAEQSYGADTVGVAEQWVLQQSQIDPAFGQKVINSPDPYGAAVTEYKQHQVMSQLSDPSRIDAFLAWESAQKAAQASPPPAAAQAVAPAPMPTRSLATAVPSSGGVAHVPTGPGQAFDNLFN